MPDNAYHFIDRWRVEGDVKEAADILEDATSLPRWWGSTYFEVKVHNWTMKRGEESLNLEVLRRRAKSSGDGSSIPAPPPPSFVVRLFKLNRP